MSVDGAGAFGAGVSGAVLPVGGAAGFGIGASFGGGTAGGSLDRDPAFSDWAAVPLDGAEVSSHGGESALERLLSGMAESFAAAASLGAAALVLEDGATVSLADTSVIGVSLFATEELSGSPFVPFGGGAASPGGGSSGAPASF